MKEKWFVSAKKADFQAIGQRFGIDQVTARIIINRGITGEEAIAAYLSCSRQQLHDPHLLKDAEKGAAILARKIREGKKIRIIGDYDIDGVNASYILTACMTGTESMKESLRRPQKTAWTPS